MKHVEDQAAFVKKQQKEQKHIRVGLVLIKIGSILFFIDSVFLILALIINPILGNIDWSNFVSVFNYVMYFFIIPFIILSAIGGLSYVKNKGPFISLVALMAIITILIFIGDFVVSLILLIQNGNWWQFLVSLLSVQLDGLIYFIGWLLSKDDFNLAVNDLKKRKKKTA